MPSLQRALAEADKALDDMGDKDEAGAKAVLERFLIAYLDFIQIVEFLEEDALGKSVSAVNHETKIPNIEDYARETQTIESKSKSDSIASRSDGLEEGDTNASRSDGLEEGDTNASRSDGLEEGDTNARLSSLAPNSNPAETALKDSVGGHLLHGGQTIESQSSETIPARSQKLEMPIEKHDNEDISRASSKYDDNLEESDISKEEDSGASSAAKEEALSRWLP
eukprot:Gregarina_sp_Poly_1__3970@NODE_2199_length_2496_cov_47_464389_g1417_i0_p1_GENE_NODE_2199_length_2496_cov_47_464389_g1417_i0NODE_2199_length_2496_cov_47_464389_g1417_i0_p1_ORF_typecomplete_len224_score47_19_NODE_2199_length_2496_cov_47_464389_g1417_i016092280